MPQPIDLDLERFKRLPAREDVWQVAIVRMPQWVVEKERPPFRALMPICHSAVADLLGTSEPVDPAAPDGQAALRAIISLAKMRDVQFRPTRVEVRDPGLVEVLRPVLDEVGIELALTERLEAIDGVLVEMTRRLAAPAGSASSFSDPAGFTSCYSGSGVTVERVRAFAEAAAAFHRAAPWNQLTDEDLLRVDSPVPEEGLRCLTVLGGGGIEQGLGFFRTAEDLDRLLAEEAPAHFLPGTHVWLLSFDPVYELPIPDSELWEEHALPLAQSGAYPMLMSAASSGLGEPADAARLTFVEGLLRALVATTEDELDSGRWSKTVATFDGECVIELSMPALLEPVMKPPAPGPGEPHELPDRRMMEQMMVGLERAIAERGLTDIGEINAFLAESGGKVPPREPDTSPAGRAQARFYEALDVHGRLRIKLALNPDCADAWGLLAEEMPDRARRTELYARAMAAAERTLGVAPFDEHVGHFWGVIETRPYMRARFGYAECLWGAGRHDEALGHLHELLRLNPEDNQGVRDVLLPRLIELGRDDEAMQLLAAFEDDPSAVLGYGRALLEFRSSGDGEAAQAKLEVAVRGNPHVTKYLSGSARFPEQLPDRYGFGTDEEAVIAAAELLGAWRVTPGAVAWLRDSRRRGKKAREQKRQKGRGKRR
jgi:tetratricopeptide (TPR) repeat protein